MATTADGRALRSFDEFARQIESLSVAADMTPAAPRWHGQRAATLARQAGACDELITAALVHDFSESVGLQYGFEKFWSTAEALALLFPEHVVGPVRLLPRVASSDDEGVLLGLRAIASR